VAETFNLSQLEGYRTGGTLHVVINNQIGFTTTPRDARSTRYCTDVAKAVEAPILHVNGDDPEASVFVAELALRFRQEFGRDVVIDLIGYRRHGHNEADEPAFTQPVLYEKIRARPSVLRQYTQALRASGDLSAEEEAALAQDFQARLAEAFRSVKEGHPPPERHSFTARWAYLNHPCSFQPVETPGPLDLLLHVARVMTSVPEGFAVNPKVARALAPFRKAVEEGGAVTWAQAEGLAFGTLLDQGVKVRLSGQDVRRGTFSQRHAVWFDVHTQEAYAPLAHVRQGQPAFSVYDSMLSEAAVLGFEYGYALAEPNALVMWEAVR